MNILYLAMESANWVINLCNEMCNQGHTVTCFVQMTDDYDRDNPPQEHENLKVFKLPMETFYTGKGFEPYFERLRTEKFDMIFGSHGPVTPMVHFLGKNLNTPWGIMLLDIPTDLIQVQPQRAEMWRRWFPYFEQADEMVFNTYVARDEYEKFTGKRFPDENVVVYGTNLLPQFRDSGKDIRGDYIVSVCRLTPLKNCSIIPKALNMISGIDKYIAIGRDGGELELIRKLCNQYGIEFEHKVEITEEHKYELIRDSAMLIYPQKTPYIGGLSPFEGMWCGKKVVVPDLKVLRDLYGDGATYFKNDDENDLIRAIMEIAPQTHGAQIAEERASYSTMSKGLIDIFKRMKKNE